MPFRWPIAMLAISALTLVPVHAQVTTGTILGSVKDGTGATIAGATVTVKEVNKGTIQKFETDENGAFYAPFLNPGTYQVAVENPASETVSSSRIDLQVDQKQRLDFTLQVGDITESVDVVASAPLVKSETAELGQVVVERAIRELPLNGRNFAQLSTWRRSHARTTR